MINGFKVGGWQESDLLVMTKNGKDYTLGNYVVEEWGASFISDIFGRYAPIAWAYAPVLDDGAVKVFERMARENEQ